MKAIEIIKSIDYAMTLNGEKFVSVRQIKTVDLNSCFVVQILNNRFLEKTFKFDTSEKALKKFYSLCLKMNLSTWNYSFIN